MRRASCAAIRTSARAWSRSPVSTNTSHGLAMAVNRPMTWSPARVRGWVGAGRGRGGADTLGLLEGDRVTHHQRADAHGGEEIELALHAHRVAGMTVAELGDVLRARGPLARAPGDAEAEGA